MSEEKKVEAPKDKWASHETLEDLLTERYRLTERSKDYLKGMQGSLAAELTKILNEYGRISFAEVSKHEKKDEIVGKLKEKAEEVLSYKNSLHPLNPYVNADNLKNDEFIRSLIDEIFTPNKDLLMKSIGERDFSSTMDRITASHYNRLEQRANEYVFKGFNIADDKHRQAAAKYLSKSKGKDITPEQFAGKSDRYLGEIYSHVVSKYS